MGESENVTLTRILHPCVLIEHAGLRILVDPCFGFFSRRFLTRHLMGIDVPAPGLEPESLGDLALIAMTHAHEDHFDAEALARLPSRRTRVVVPTSSQARKARRMGFDHVDCLSPWDTAAGEGWSLTSVPARAPNARREVSYVVKVGGLSILHAGDTAAHPHFEEIRDRCAPVAGCLPVSGVSILGLRLTMAPEEAARASALLRLRLAIPIHAEMRFRRLSSLLYRAPGTEMAFLEAARRLTPATRVLVAPQGRPVALGPLLDEPESLRYPQGR